MNPENNPNVQDIRLQTTLLLSISNMETKPTPLSTDLPFRKYLVFTMKSVSQFSFQDIGRVCRALGKEIQYKLITQKQGDVEMLRTYFQQIHDRIQVLTGGDTLDSDKVIQGSEYLTQILHLLPSEMRADVEKNIIKNLLEYEDAIMKKTKQLDGTLSDTMADNYLIGISPKQINYNTQVLPKSHRALAKFLASLEKVREEVSPNWSQQKLVQRQLGRRGTSPQPTYYDESHAILLRILD